MAIDPRIALQVRAPDVTPALNLFNNALTSAVNRDVAQQQAAQSAEMHPLLIQQQEQALARDQQAISQSRDISRLTAINETGQRIKPLLEAGNVQGAQAFLVDNIAKLQARINNGENVDITESTEALAKLQNGDVQGLLGDINSISRLVSGGQQQSVAQREFNDLVNIVKSDPKLESTEGKAAAIKLGIKARASTSATERIATDPVLTNAVAASQAEIAGEVEGAKEGAKLVKQLTFKPKITKAVKLAEKAAAETGDVLSSLQRSQAALPGLLEAVGQLKELSQVATSTLGGKVFDFAVKQSGFGSTKGATSRAKFVAIVNNQVLPLLKETFGAAFTAQEGEALKATMGDPDSSSEEKMAQLDAFVAQKMRDIETRERQLEESVPDSINRNQPAQQEGQIMIDANGNRAMVFPDGTFKEL